MHKTTFNYFKGEKCHSKLSEKTAADFRRAGDKGSKAAVLQT